MNIKPDTILNTELNIIETVDKAYNYYIYSALNTQNGNVVYVIEYFPDGGARGDDGAVIISYETIKPFDIWVNNFITNADITFSLAINSFLKVISSFDQTGTGYVVTEKIDGESLKEFLDRKGSPFTIDEATPIYLELLRSVTEAAENHRIYFHINPNTVFITKEGTLRMYFLYAHEYTEHDALSDIVKLYYFMLHGRMPSDIPDTNISPNLPTFHRNLLETLGAEAREGVYTSLKDFYTDIAAIYSNERTRKPSAQKKDRRDLRFALVMLSIAVSIVLIITFSTFMLSKIFIGDPLAPKVDANKIVTIKDL